MPGRGGGVGPAVQLQASCDSLAGTLTAQQLPNNRQPHHHRLLVPAASSASPTYSQPRQGPRTWPPPSCSRGWTCQRACKSRPRGSEGFPIFCSAQRLAELCPEQHFVAEERASKPVLPLSCSDDHKPQQQNTEQRRARGNAPVVPTCRAARVNVLNSLIGLRTFLCRRGGPKRAWTFQIDSRFQPKMRPVGGRKSGFPKREQPDEKKAAITMRHCDGATFVCMNLNVAIADCLQRRLVRAFTRRTGIDLLPVHRSNVARSTIL